MASKTQRAGSPGSHKVTFKDQKITLEELLGDKPISYMEMQKILWDHIRKNNLIVQ